MNTNLDVDKNRNWLQSACVVWPYMDVVWGLWMLKNEGSISGLSFIFRGVYMLWCDTAGLGQHVFLGQMICVTATTSIQVQWPVQRFSYQLWLLFNSLTFLQDCCSMKICKRSLCPCAVPLASFPGHTREGTRLYTAYLLVWRVSVCITFPSYIHLTWWMEHSFSIPCGSVSLCINSIPICFHTPCSCLCPCPHPAASTFSIYLILGGCLVIDIILYCHIYV